MNTLFEIVRRKPKHRYIYLVGDRKQRQAMMTALKYPQSQYPKGESRHYEADARIETQMAML